MIFWILWAFDALFVLGWVCFFMIGLADGTVSSFNILLWLGILTVLFSIMGGSILLRYKGLSPIAYVLLGLLAIPTLLIILVSLIFMIAPPDFK